MGFVWLGGPRLAGLLVAVPSPKGFSGRQSQTSACKQSAPMVVTPDRQPDAAPESAKGSLSN